MDELYAILQEAKRQWGIETVNAIKQKIQDGGIIWKSTLLDSIGLNQDDTLDGNITFKMTEYGKFIDEGVNGIRSAYATPYGFSGDKDKIRKMAWAIKPWADSKGLNPWAVANSIQRKGIKPRLFFKSVVEARLPDLADRINIAYQTYLNELVNRQQNP